MSRARRRRPEWTPGALLDWTDHAHWAWTPKPCVYCGNPTQLRDSRRRPADKVCAEAALNAQATDDTEGVF